MEKLTIHELKILPKYYKDVVSGVKNFELRRDDRDYKWGDVLRLEEWDGDFTGESTIKVITYILKDCSRYGLKDGYVILGLK